METTVINATEYRELPLALLNESKTNPRRVFDDVSLRELAASIRSQGVLSPLLVRPLTENGFEIVAGARRYRAAQMAEAITVPVRIKQMGDAEVLEAQLVENLIRAEIHPMEEAEGFARLLALEEPKYSIEQIAAKVGKHPSFVACRISEALALIVSDFNFEDLLVTLDGKGRKQRVVPFSFELRKALFRYIAEFRKPDALLFASRTETDWNRRNVLRDVKLLCRKLGFAPPARTVHALRHTFAVNYLRRGGSVFHLQKVLGHSTLEMTRRYANLVTADLQAVHERVTLLK